MKEKDNYLKNAELSTEQNYNMINGILSPAKRLYRIVGLGYRGTQTAYGDSRAIRKAGNGGIVPTLPAIS